MRYRLNSMLGTAGPRCLTNSLNLLIGKLQFASQVIRAGCVFLACLLDELGGSPKKGFVPVPSHIIQDLKWWQYIMPILNGTKSIYLDIFFNLVPLSTQMPHWWVLGECVKVIISTPLSLNLLYSKPISLLI